MNKITIVMAYYMNPSMLEKQAEFFSAYPDDLKPYLQLIVTDDGSPTKPAKHCDIGFPFELYRMKQDIRWNQDACRNVGAHHAKHPWLLLCDMDHLIPAETIRALVEDRCHMRDINPEIETSFDASRIYKFERKDWPNLEYKKPHPNTWFVTHKRYWRAGGYDERFAGYYGTDAEFRDRMHTQCGTTIYLQECIYRVPREVIADASTTTYARKEPFDGPTIRRIKAERDALPDWKPLNLTFPYERIA